MTASGGAPRPSPFDSDADLDPVGPFRVTPGFLVFVSAMVLPAIAATLIVLGAWFVSDEVYAAEAAANGSRSGLTAADFSDDRTEVAGWKKALVGVCPIH